MRSSRLLSFITQSHLTCTLCFLVTCLLQGSNAVDNTYRLPWICRPLTYELSLKPDFYDPNARPTFNGSVVITVTCSECTSRITLHQLDLSISEVNVTSPQGKALSFTVEEDLEREFYTIVLDVGEAFQAGATYTLYMAFSGFMTPGAYGLYKASYRDGDGNSVGYAATQMQPTGARYVFPCFDEPGFKSRFSARIARRTDTERNYRTLFSSPRLSSSVDPEDERWTVDIYGPSPVMSSYLVAVVVSDFESLTTYIDLGEVHDGKPSGVMFPYRTYARPNYTEAITIAQEAGVHMFKWLDKHFSPPYEDYLPKIDSVSDPAFNGGMENWGLVLYSSRLIEYYKGVTGMETIRTLLSLTAHELAHQWYGNIITCNWWDDLWLNEGFASYWEQYVVDQLYPTMKQTEFFVTQKLMHIMKSDGSSQSHALYTPVATPREVWGMFSSYTYSKGGAIVRMLHMILGEHFFPALTQYQETYQSKTVNHGDLFKTLDDYGQAQNLELDLSERMLPWVRQKGYPVLIATRDVQAEQVVFTQVYFPVKDMDIEFEAPYWNLFDIPFIMTNDLERQENVPTNRLVNWLLRSDIQVSLPLTSDAAWFVVNERHLGYYRVLYDDSNYRALHQQLMTNPEVFDVLTRLTILDDAFSFYKAGGEFSNAVKEWPFVLTQYLKAELSFSAWHIFQQEMHRISPLLLNSDPPLFKKYTQFLKKITGPVLSELTLDMPGDVPTEDLKMRLLLARLACKSGEDYCTKYALKAVKKYMEDSAVSRINERLIWVLFCGVMAHEGKKGTAFQYTRDSLANLTNNRRERENRVASLACTTSESLAYGFLNATLNNTVPGLEYSGDMAWVMKKFAYSPFNNLLTLHFLATHFEDILKRIGSNYTSQKMVRELLMNSATSSPSYEVLQPVLERMQTMGESWSGLVDQINAIATANAAYLETNRAVFTKWLSA